ncbi:MAG: hypothetical protein A2Y41_05585 [Spirochaetes bacterium GWB1_36_13]|nr:MAG: hypothetical protein A2Y41_05585 [Spirochaetes bacterium GWB1_36_13]
MNFSDSYEHLLEEKELIKKISFSDNLDSLLGDITDFLKSRWNFDAIGIQLVDEEKQKLVSYRYYGFDDSKNDIKEAVHQDVSLQDEDSISAVVAKTKKTRYSDCTIVEHLENMRPKDRETVKALGIKENLIVPILFDNFAIGVFHCSSYNKLNLDKEKIAAIEDFVSSVAGSLQMVRKKEELEKIRLEHEETIQLVKKINSVIEISELFDLLGKEIEKTGCFDGYFISILDPEKQNLITEKITMSQKFKNMEKVLIKKKTPLETSPEVFFQSLLKSVVLDQSSISKYNENTKRMFALWECRYGVYIPFIQDFQTNSVQDALGLIFLYTHENQIPDSAIQKIRKLIELFYKQTKNSIFYTLLKEKEKEILTAAEKNRKILSIAETINNLTSLSQIYRTILKEVLSLFGFDYAMVFMEKNNRLDFVMNYIIHPKHQHIAENVIQYQKEAKGYLMDAHDGACPSGYLRNIYFYFDDVQPILHLPMSQKDKDILKLMETPRTLLLIPIRKDGKPIGSVHLYTLEKPLGLKENDLTVLESLFSLIGSAISNAQLYTLVEEQKKQVEEQKLKLEEQNAIIKTKNYQLLQELKLAEKIQQKLIPSVFPYLLNTRFASLYKPMENIGGDFFDFIKGEQEKSLGIFISDVSGHGVPAALITSMLKSVLDSAGEKMLEPHELLSYVNRRLVGQTSGNFLTAFYGIYDSESKLFKYSRASHNYPFLLREDSIIPLKSKGKILGIMDDLSFEEKEIQLEKGDKILFYTDGLTEATNISGDEFEDVLPDILVKNHRSPITSLIESVYHELLKFREDYHFEDDVCMVGMEIV